MTSRPGAELTRLSDPALAAMLCAVDPVGLGGVAVRARAGPLRDRWAAGFRALLPPGTPWRRMPPGVADGRLFGGLDLTATLAAGRPIAERGLLAEADGGVLLLPMAERISSATAARLAAVLDSGSVALERDGLADRFAARLGMVAFDEGLEPDETAPPAIRERLAFHIDLDGFDPTQTFDEPEERVASARTLYRSVLADDAILTALGETALALGVRSLQTSVLALRAARAAAALHGRLAVGHEDAALAARLVLAPRATRLPAALEPEQTEPHEPGEAEPEASQPSDDDDRPDRDQDRPQETSPDEMVLAAARAAIPPGLLRLLEGAVARGSRPTPGRSGAPQSAAKRGRPAGVRRGTPGGGVRLNVIETLRAAAPWQKLRRSTDGAGHRIQIRRDDLRVTRFKQRSETVTIFVVDASGSLALNRLAEAKGAVELLLADCYVRRDQVALLAFRGTGTDLLLPPTRSLTRARRSLADLPGGGATPLAGAIDAAVDLAAAIRRRGQTPVVVFMTDGRANVARDGTSGRGKAEADTRLAATAAALTGVRMLVVDAAQRPQPSARALADAMRAIYVPLPRAEAAALSRAVREAAAG